MNCGKLASVRSGNVIVYGSAPYGQACVREGLPGGTRSRLEPVEEQAAFVRLILAVCAEGWSIKRIMARLTELGITTASDLGKASGRGQRSSRAAANGA